MRVRRAKAWAAAALLGSATCVGCGTSVYRPAQTAGFELDPATEITDEDVRKAFAAKPQLPAEVNVAYYVFDDDDVAGIEAMLSSLPQVKKVYRIPTLLVTGKRRFDEPRWHAPVDTPPLSIKKLRLLAARAGADVLLIFDYGHRITYSANGLVAFGVLLLPTFFLPWQDVEAESYLDTYAIDTRNGYLYGQVTAGLEAEEDYLLIYSDRGEELVEAHRSEMIAEAGRLLRDLLAQSSSAVAPAPRPYADGPTAPGGAVPAGSIRITFGPDGAIFVNGERFASAARAKARVAAIARSGSAEAVIEARPGVRHEVIVGVLDMLREANVKSVGIERSEQGQVDSSTAPPPPPDEPDPAAIPNPSSGAPAPITPTPVYPPAGSAQPLIPNLEDRQ